MANFLMDIDSTEAWDDHPSLSNLDFTASIPIHDPFTAPNTFNGQTASIEKDDLIQTLTQSESEPQLSNKEKLSLTLAGRLPSPDTEDVVSKDSTEIFKTPESSSNATVQEKLIEKNQKSKDPLNKISLLDSNTKSMSFTADSTSPRHSLLSRKRSVGNLMSSVILEPMTDPLSMLIQSPVEIVDVDTKDMTDSLFIGNKLSKLHIQTATGDSVIDLLSPLPITPVNEIEIRVTEPTTIKDMIGSHTTYRIVTKTALDRFKKTESVVLRRFKDFYFLYQYLVAKYPGFIVPAVPQKVVMGRFQDEFIENRREALERCLRKIASHQTLSHDPEFQNFLESETWTIEKPKEESKALFSLFEQQSKPIEIDPEMETKITQIDALEIQLKELFKLMDSFIKQRKEFAHLTGEMGKGFVNVGEHELNPDLAFNLALFGNLQQSVKLVHDKQANEDFKHIVLTIEEYLRTIGSVRSAIAGRTKLLVTWRNSESLLIKKKELLEKLEGSMLRPLDKISKIGEEIKEAIPEEKSAKHALNEITSLLKKEIDQFEVQKIVDFKVSVKEFLKSLLSSQRDIVAQWESYSGNARVVIPSDSPIEPISL